MTDFSVSAQEYREIGGQIAGRNTSLLHIEYGTVRRLALYWDRDGAFCRPGHRGVCDVSGELMTPAASPSTDEIGETGP